MEKSQPAPAAKLETVADANPIGTLKPVLALAAEFVSLGVRFDRPILILQYTWQGTAQHY
jgi:hypothetical protein